MKKYNLLLLICLIIGQACKKPGTETTPISREPFYRPVGIPLAGKSPATLTIGANGGKITSTDGSLTLEVPPGAVSASTVFEIQEVNQTLEGNNRPSYKLSPEGTAFLKPITIRFNYSGYNLDGTISEMLAPAYQDDKGLYHAPQEFVNDKAKKILSVSTTHFSNWTLYDWYRLDGPDVVGTEGNIRVKLMTYPFLSSLTGGSRFFRNGTKQNLTMKQHLQMKS